MLVAHTIRGLATLSLLGTLFPTTAPAQTTIDFEELRRNHDLGEPATSSAEQPSIQIESSGAKAAGAAPTLELPLERDARQMLVPAVVGSRSVYFVFDTGATYTTLTPTFAREIGATIPADGPSSLTDTANGRFVMRFGLLSSLRLAGRDHQWVTFGICPSCGGGFYRGKPVVGLLGLNVLRRYRLEVEHAKGRVRLHPSASWHDVSHDVRPWLDVRHGSHTADTMRMKVKNIAPETVEVTMQITCGSDDEHRSARRSIPSGEQRDFSFSVRRSSCLRPSFGVASARWF